jgi:hypothetical protein
MMWGYATELESHEYASRAARENVRLRNDSLPTQSPGLPCCEILLNI